MAAAPTVAELDREQLFRLVPIAVFTVDRHRTITSWNPEAERITGYTAAEVLGRACLLFSEHPCCGRCGLFSPDIPKPVAAGECSIRRKDGEKRIIRKYADLLTDAAGNVVGGIEAFTDITALTEAEDARRQEQTARAESEAAFRTIGMAAQDAIIMIDHRGRVVYWNDAAHAIFGHHGSDVLGRELHPIIAPPELQQAYRDGFAEFVRSGTGNAIGTTLELPALHADGTRFPVELSLSAVQRDGAWHAIGIVRDITGRRETERELQRHREQLEELVEARTRELSNANNALQALNRELARSNQELEQFAYVASHDLQEPLRMISSYTQLLERRYRDRLDEKASRYIAHAVDGATRMQTLIKDLLAYSRIQSRPRTPTPVDTGAVVRQVLADLARAIDDAGAEITVADLPVVDGDRTQLQQLFQNLIANALKFRAERPVNIAISVRNGDLMCEETRVSESVDAANADCRPVWTFTVRDNGIGIEERHQQRIFEIFQRLHPRTRYPGTGIGLAICKRIVERHGGRIWVRSRAGEGASFLFTLPKIAPETEAEPT